jgi:glutamyl-tRNA synthetase
LLLSSPQQIYLSRLLGFTPPHFVHLPLLCNAQGQRLSKRDSSLDMASLRQRYTAPQLVGLLAHLIGLLPAPQPVAPADLLPIFSWDKIPLHDITMKAGCPI